MNKSITGFIKVISGIIHLPDGYMLVQSDYNRTICIREEIIVAINNYITVLETVSINIITYIKFFI